MSIKVDSGYSAFFSISIVRDDEWQRIIDRLWHKYGIRSTGSKAADKAKLHELEIKEAELLGGECDCGRFLTVERSELEKIRNKRRDKKIEKDPKNFPNTEKGAKILGEQLYLAIKMKKEHEDLDNKKKRDNKYYSG